MTARHVSADDRERWQERAAIMEFDGGLSRPAAEWAAARALGLKLSDLVPDTARRTADADRRT